MSFCSFSCQFSPLEDNFTTFLQIHSTHILSWHVLLASNQSLPAYKFNTSFNSHILAAFGLLSFAYRQTNVHTYVRICMHAYIKKINNDCYDHTKGIMCQYINYYLKVRLCCHALCNQSNHYEKYVPMISHYKLTFFTLAKMNRPQTEGTGKFIKVYCTYTLLQHAKRHLSDQSDVEEQKTKLSYC